MKPTKTIPNSIDSIGQSQAVATSQNKVDVGVKKILCPLLALPNEKVKIELSDHEDEKLIEKPKPTLSEKKNDSKKKTKNYSRSRSRSSSRSYSSDDSGRKSSRKRKNKKKDRRRSRSRSNRRHRTRSRSRNRRSRSVSSNDSTRDRYKKRKSDLPLEPIVGQIYDGTVSSIMQFGCFVQLQGLKKLWEGLVHISNVSFNY